MLSGKWSAAGDRCPVCEGSHTIAFKARAHDGAEGSTVEIIECKDCTFAWQFPLGRSAAESVVHFQQNYYPVDGVRAGYFEGDYKQKTVEVELDFVASLPIEGRRLLDVGGGSGAFGVAAARRGWRTTVVDPALDISVLDQFDVRAMKGYATDLPEGEVFDVVTMWDVIEHVEDPMMVLSALCDRVAEGGWLILETGNYKSRGRVEGDRQHWIYQLDHRWYFSPQSLGAMLESIGMAVVGSAQKVLRPEWRGQEDYPGPTVRQLVSRVLRSPGHLSASLQLHKNLKIASNWPQSGLEIFCLAARHKP